MAIIYECTDLNDLQNTMLSDINKLNIWMHKNSLSINEEKTKFMIFHQKTKMLDPSYLTIKINNHTIEEVCHFKYLGLWIDNKLNWNQHIEKINNKIRKINFTLCQLRNVLPIKSKYLIFNSHVMSSIRYLLPIWGSASNTKKTETHRLINKSIKLIKNLPLLTPTMNLYDNKIVSLHSLYTYETLLLIYKIKNNIIKNNFILTIVEQIQH